MWVGVGAGVGVDFSEPESESESESLKFGRLRSPALNTDIIRRGSMGWALGRAPPPLGRSFTIQNALFNSVRAPVHHWAPTLGRNPISALDHDTALG